MAEKPFKGNIHNWKVAYFDKTRHPFEVETQGYCIIGKPEGHPSFTGWIKTSPVVKFNQDDLTIETLNSRYQLVGSQVVQERLNYIQP